MELNLVQRLLLIGILFSEVQTKEKPGPMSSECLGNLLRITLSAEYFENKHLSLSVVDQSGTAWELGEAMAAQCGYAVTYSSWGSIEFRASALSCHSRLEKDVFTVTIQIKASPTSDMSNATTHLKSASCHYGPWSPRELICGSNYMEISVRSEVPQTIKDFVQDEPEDWTFVFPEAKAEAASIWQIVFHQPEEKRALLVSNAWSAGYGLNTTDSRVLLRVPHTAAQVQLVKDQGITFSVLRSSTFYKYQWVILMVDTGVACPVDGVDYANKTITWTVPKYIPPLSAGVTSFKDVLVEAGVDLRKLSAKEMASRKYVLLNELNAIMMKIPIGAEGGYYKTSVSNGQLGTKYSISLFLEHQWEDSRWGLTKHTIIKEIETPFEQAEVSITNILPSARGFCDGRNLHLIVSHGNVDQNWLPFISDWHLTPEGAQKYNYSLRDNGTHLAISVPFLSSHVNYEGFHTSAIKASFYLTLKDGLTLAHRRDFSVSCIFSPSELIQCLPNGTVIITAIKLVGDEDLDTALLVLRDRQCKPSLVTEKTATFKFNVNTCGTSRKFNGTTMTYENEVLYFRPGNDTPIYQLKFLCSYAVEQTVDARYESKKSPPPSIKPGFGCLTLSLKLFKEKSYSEPYQESEYPVVKYLREALYFEVELLQPKDARLDLNLDDCWATNSQSQDSLPQWHILKHGCENNKGSYRAVLHKVNYSLRAKFPQHLKRFEVRMFAFVQGTSLLQEQLYFHCSVVICNTKQQPLDVFCPRRCNPGKHRLAHSAHPHGQVSSGPVLVRKKNNQERLNALTSDRLNKNYFGL
ncbi:zona pellucida sperm-binding protein 2-like isoform 2-T2 [Cyanocitta cristata]